MLLYLFDYYILSNSQNKSCNTCLEPFFQAHSASFSTGECCSFVLDKIQDYKILPKKRQICKGVWCRLVWYDRGMQIKVKVFPKSRQDKVVAKANDRYEVYLRAEARDGEANERLVEILKKYFGVERVRITRGGQTRNKYVDIDTKILGV